MGVDRKILLFMKSIRNIIPWLQHLKMAEYISTIQKELVPEESCCPVEENNLWKFSKFSKNRHEISWSSHLI